MSMNVIALSLLIGGALSLLWATVQARIETQKRRRIFERALDRALARLHVEEGDE